MHDPQLFNLLTSGPPSSYHGSPNKSRELSPSPSWINGNDSKQGGSAMKSNQSELSDMLQNRKLSGLNKVETQQKAK